jgi:hypothetical protein
MANQLALDSLNSAKYLCQPELSEPRDNSLHLVVQEAAVNPAGSVRPHPELPESEGILRTASPTESAEVLPKLGSNLGALCALFGQGASRVSTAVLKLTLCTAGSVLPEA